MKILTIGDFLVKINEIFKFINIGTKKCIIKEYRKEKSIFYLKYSSTLLSKKFFNIIYNNSNIYLERKYNIYKTIIK